VRAGRGARRVGGGARSGRAACGRLLVAPTLSKRISVTGCSRKRRCSFAQNCGRGVACAAEGWPWVRRCCSAPAGGVLPAPLSRAAPHLRVCRYQTLELGEFRAREAVLQRPYRVQQLAAGAEQPREGGAALSLDFRRHFHCFISRSELPQRLQIAISCPGPLAWRSARFAAGSPSRTTLKLDNC
jgi:hypothetical protein